MPELDAILEEATKGRLRIITSTLSVTEVAFGASERADRALDAATEAKIDALWTPGGPAIVVEPSFVIAQRARQFVREAMVKRWRLTPRDAIHLATASVVGASVFHTYDQKLDKFHEIVGLQISRPLARQPSLFGGQADQPKEQTDESGP